MYDLLSKYIGIRNINSNITAKSLFISCTANVIDKYQMERLTQQATHLIFEIEFAVNILYVVTRESFAVNGINHSQQQI